jgi:putative RNA 2'-phosphotransferase
LAVAIAKRREPEPILIEILAAKANQDGIPLRSAGEHLYLIESMPEHYLVFPLLPQQNHVQPSKDRKKENHRSGKTSLPLTSAGSFLVGPGQIKVGGGMEAVASTGGVKAGGWKRNARKLRQKRHM